MKLSDLRGKSRADQIATAAQYAGVEPSVLEGMWRTESANGTQMLSPAGARGHFGIMPHTQATWEKKAGTKLNPDSFEDALYMGAETLKENMSRFGNVEDALRAYNGGWNKANWENPETTAYVGKVLGMNFRQNTGVVGREINGKTLTMDDLRGMSPDEFSSLAPKDVLKDRSRFIAPKHTNVEDAVRQSIVTPNMLGKVQDFSTDRPFAEAQKREAADVAVEAAKPDYQFDDKFVAAFVDQSLTSAMSRAIGRDAYEGDPEWNKKYVENWQELEKVAENEDEARILRGSTSQPDFDQRLAEIKERRSRRAIYGSDGEAEALGYSLLAGVADPAGWALGLGVGKSLQLAGVGSRALLAAGKTGQAALSLAGENMIGGVLGAAALDVAGEHMTTKDYAFAAGSGLVIAGLSAPFVLRGKPDFTLDTMAKAQRDNSIKENAVLLEEAQRNVGAEATPEQMTAEVIRLENARTVSEVRLHLADVPEEHRFLAKSPEAFITADPAKKADIASRYDTASISAQTERDMVEEIIAQAERITEANPVGKGASTVLSKITAGGNRGLESTSMTLSRSPSATARAVNAILLESPTGSAGRRRTASMAMAVRERMYNRDFLMEYDSFYHSYRKSRGVSVFSEAWEGKTKRQFDRAVALEVESRGTPDRVGASPDPMVQRAADQWEKGMDRMRREQQAVDTVGSARLGESSVGYFTHKLDARKVGSLTKEQARNVRSILAGQFHDPEGKNGFDRPFSEKLAAKYLEVATDKQYGMAPVPMNLHSPEAGDMVRNALEAIGLAGEDLEKAVGKFSRGGASHTKKRLRLDLDADIGGGEKLIDLFNTDLTSLYRSYSRRVAGEVALAQYGVMGRKGMQVLKQAMKQDGATPGEMEAFDQIAAEFLNMPFGQHNHNYMDNTRIATSLSRLGGMGFTQLGEYGNALAALGVHRTFDAIKALPRLAKEIGQLKVGGEAKNSILDSIDTLGGHIGMDDYTNTRLFDIKDNDIQMYGAERLGVMSRALRAGANLQAMASGHRMITAVQTRGMAEQIIHKAVKFIKAGTDSKALEDMGFTKEVQDAIRTNMDDIAKFDAKGNLTEFNLLKGQIASTTMHEIRDAVERGASQIIQRTYIGETGKWAHDGFLKLLLQFRTFSLVSVEKQWGRNVKNYGALQSSMYLLGAMSFAVPIHMARIHARTVGMSRAQREEYIDKNMSVGSLARATVGYASASGLLGDVYDVGVSAMSSFGGAEGENFGEAAGVRGGNNRRLIGGVLAPGVAQIEDVYGGVMNHDPHKIIRAMPGANLPFMQPLVNLTKDDE